MYPQNPVTVCKGNHIVKDVYRSDLDSWLAEGYEIYDPSEPKPEAKIEVIPVIAPKPEIPPKRKRATE